MQTSSRRGGARAVTARRRAPSPPPPPPAPPPQGERPSPTFAIVQPYQDREPPVWHVDLYRIEQPGEIDELGLDAVADAALIVEWPERAGDATWPEALRLTLDFA